MFTTLLLTAATAFSSLAAAQNYSTSGPLTVVPTSVDPVYRNIWCNAQRSSCPLICGGVATPNTCDSETLTYVCTCENGSKPNISDYANTLPSFECMQWIIDCTAAHPNDAPGQQACQSVVCGMKNASAINAGSASSSSSAAPMSASSMPASASVSNSMSMTTKTGSGGPTTTSEMAQSTSSPGAAAAVVAVGGNYGVGILSAVMLGLFGFAL